MGLLGVNFNKVFCADAPTFFPGNTPLEHHAMVTVINNRGTSRNNKELKDEVTLNFWGKLAQTAAIYLNKGWEISGYGELLSHTKDEGQLRPDGKKILIRSNEVRVTRFWFGTTGTLKEMTARVNQNIAQAKASGKLPAQATVTAEDMLNIEKQVMTDYNPTIAGQTGKYGNARVYITGQGFITPGVGAPPPAGQFDMATIQAEMAALRQQLANATMTAQVGAGQDNAQNDAANTVVDPFNC